MKKLIFNPQPIWSDAILLLRVWVGLIFISHGISIFHAGAMESFVDTLKIENIPFPYLSAGLSKSSEFFGGICLIVGFLKRPACLFLIINMAVATFVAGNGELLQNGRTSFILLICCLIISLLSTDKLSIDWLVYKNKINQTL